jgi:putative spermidine/putrescine transport system substrate-binding protein
MYRIGRSRAAVVAALAALALTACGGGGSGGGGQASGGGPALPKIPVQQSLGQGEGQLNLVNWAGYAEDGSNDPKVDWVHPFEQATGCKVNDKIGNTSDEMVQLMKTGQYDGVSASGDATLRLIYGGLVAPVNTKLVANYATVQPFLKDRAWNSVKGQMYGIPHGWGANLLMYRPDVVHPAPTSWGAVFSATSPYKGRITAYDSPIYIADAALYLMRTKPSLGIKNPYALDKNQLNAAVDLLLRQNKQIGEYWADYTKAVQAIESGNSVLGTTWQVIANLVKADGKVPVATVLPSEGATGWSDTWMVAAKAAHPVCMYKWMNWIISPKVNAEVAEWFGEAPAQAKSCSLTSDPSFCDTYHAADSAFANKIWYWTTPTTNCLDGRGNICTDYATWTQKWTQVKG